MSNYFANLRREYIKRTLYVYGYINRSHLVRRFDISPQQASKDLQSFMTDEPDAMIYSVQLKTYINPNYPSGLIKLTSSKATTGA